MDKQVLLYVPAQLPAGALHDFVLTHSAGEQGQDAWALLTEQVAVRHNPIDQLLHRLWLEGGGNPKLKVGEVSEQNVADLLHGLKKLADEACEKEPEEQIMQIQDFNGEPTLYFPGTSKTQVRLLFTQIASLLEHTAPFASDTIKKAIATWKKLKATGHT